MTMDAEKLKECFAAIEKGDTEYVAKFIKKGKIDGALLYTAARNGQSEIVDLLLGKSAQVDFQQEDGETALMAASKEGHEEVVKSLLKSGANPNLVGHDKQTALMFAAQKGHSGVARILAEGGAHLNMQDKDGWSALMFSIKEGHTATIEVLLDWDADPNLQSVDWESAMSLALKQGDDQLSEEIRTKLNEKAESHHGPIRVKTGDRHIRTAVAMSRRRNCFVRALTAPFRCILRPFRREPRTATATPPITTESSDTKGQEDSSGVPVCMGTLTLLKWKDSDGRPERFYLINKVSSKWKMFGYRFEREPDELEALEDEYSRNAKRCWCKVMELWLGEGGTSEYPTTWEGLVVVLEDVEYSSVARELERVLESVMHPPIPPPE